MSAYLDLLKAVEQYYGYESDQWIEIAKYGVAGDDFTNVVTQIPGVNVVTSDSGKVLSYTVEKSINTGSVISDVAESINSNVQTGTSAISSSTVIDVPAECVKEVGSETIKATSGVAKAGNFITGKVIPVATAVSVGTSLGKIIDKSLYSINPEFFDENGMSTLNPDVWNDIVSTDTLGGKFFNFILGTNENNVSQAYMEETAYAYMAQYLESLNVFGGAGNYTGSIPFNPSTSVYEYSGKAGVIQHRTGSTVYEGCTAIPTTKKVAYLYEDYMRELSDGSSWRQQGISCYSNENGVVLPYQGLMEWNSSTGEPERLVAGAGWQSLYSDSPSWSYEYFDVRDFNAPVFMSKEALDNYLLNNVDDEAINRYGGVEGIETQEDAKTPTIDGTASVYEVLQSLKEQYPELWDNAITNNVVQPDGSINTYTYVPVPTPNTDDLTHPVTDNSSNQKNPSVNPTDTPENILDSLAKFFSELGNPTNTKQDTEVGTGDTPTVITPTGSANALWTIYNPTEGELRSLGAWLWSSDFVDQLLKVFSNPMEAIIGLHKVFASPSISGRKNIKVGYLDSGVASNVVGNQYTSVDCGTVKLSEFFGNVFDYEPYTNVKLYLPFIGIVPLDISNIMRSSISVKYHVDVLSGSCLAEVTVKRDGSGGILYTYSGNCSVQYPLSSGSYMGVITGALSIAGGIAGTIATGGALTPLLLGSAGAVGRMHTDVQQSGSIAGNSGAMGIKKPYLIISRPIPEMATNFNNFVGYPSNFYTTIGACSGFTKVRECHVDNIISATDYEKTEIETLLKTGVIVR